MFQPGWHYPPPAWRPASFVGGTFSEETGKGQILSITFSISVLDVVPTSHIVEIVPPNLAYLPSELVSAHPGRGRLINHAPSILQALLWLPPFLFFFHLANSSFTRSISPGCHLLISFSLHPGPNVLTESTIAARLVE